MVNISCLLCDTVQGLYIRYHRIFEMSVWIYSHLSYQFLFYRYITVHIWSIIALGNFDTKTSIVVIRGNGVSAIGTQTINLLVKSQTLYLRRCPSPSRISNERLSLWTNKIFFKKHLLFGVGLFQPLTPGQRSGSMYPEKSIAFLDTKSISRMTR